MDGPPDFILVDDFIAGLFHHTFSWNDVMLLLLVCHQFNYIGQKQAINIPFHINTDFDFEKFTVPSTMAKVVHIDCNISTKEAVFDHIINSLTNCFVVGINFNNLNDLTTIKKICSTVLKKGMTLDILSPCRFEMNDIIYMLIKTYHKEYEEYKMKQSGSKLIKRKRSKDDFIMLRVPKDIRLRQKFLLEHILQMTDSSPFDVFYHNHRYYDDCAHSLNRIDRVTTAKVSRKTYTDKQFMEISIFAGHYELLVVGGYIHRHGIKIPALASEYISTTRLLNKYVKCHSRQLWGFYCARSFAKGFYPISPVELMDHASQKFRKLNNHHFNSVAIKDDDLEALWSLVIRLPFFKTKMKAVSTTPTNFAEMSDVLKKIKNDSHIGSLIHILGSIQIKTPCFLLSLYDETVAKDIALKIMTSGLKREIQSQHDTIINKVKKDL
ncbi:uncharacterized protein BX663DRAFT_532368 [Cokeromyces recurvatus]|uniref:uncharacterized protein n=1 Tax=Cokeromyces recurvatus TaxID=90255 RepID=UPI00221E4CB0|nr:uncharacterized protein BX663DRAFT_532368 [Cokeromyces recurvatus]KAI7900484.1 hypothetical protein BX663DRAFT_532368 [Cokeromyces recurvatus]